MNAALEVAGVAIAALLSENLILVNSMGITGRQKSLEDPVDALRTGYCLTLVMVCSTLFTWTADRLILTPLRLEFYRLLVFTLVTMGTVWGLQRFIRACLPELARRTEGNLDSVTTNCAALGCVLLISQRSYGLGSALVFALFGGLGATAALASFASLQLEVDLECCPRCFRGTPIKLITAGLMALALVGYYGLHIDL